MKEIAYERAFREWCRREGIGWEQLRYPRAEAGGDTLAYRLTPAAPPRAALLAVHGAGNDALFALVGLFRDLLRRGIEIFSFDLDGHGRGSTTRLTPAAARSAIPAAIERWGITQRDLPVHALGVSLGGSLLLGALPALSSSLASATLMVAPLRVHLSWSAMLGELRPPLLRTLWRERGHYGLTGLVPSFGPFKRDLYPLRLGVPPGAGPFGYVEVLNRMLTEMRLEEAARGIALPVLLVYGRDDRLVPPEQGERLAGLLRRSELLVLDGETHLSAPMAPRAAARLLQWVEEHDAPGRRGTPAPVEEERP